MWLFLIGVEDCATDLADNGLFADDLEVVGGQLEAAPWTEFGTSFEDDDSLIAVKPGSPGQATAKVVVKEIGVGSYERHG